MKIVLSPKKHICWLFLLILFSTAQSIVVLGQEKNKETIVTVNNSVDFVTVDDGSNTAPYEFHTLGFEEIVPAEKYMAGPVRRFLFGPGYRRIWATSVQVPVIDLDKTAGGLTVLEKGGGFQTTSLRLKGEDGHEYVLRSVDKDPSLVLPDGMRGTWISFFAKDQTASVNPFGAFIIPTLAKAARVLHTVPVLVLVPDHPRLGEFRELMAGMLALFEMRPDEDMSSFENFGFSKNVVGSEKLLEEVTEDNSNRVDEELYARTRLFDNLIGDWDRHDDQYRWGEVELETGEKRYMPIPRDRDFAFVKFKGFFHRLARHSGINIARRMVNFSGEIPDIYGLNQQGAKLDRRFLSGLTRQDWINIATSLKNAIPDSVIETAIHGWPGPVYNQVGTDVIYGLRSRRDNLTVTAVKLYDLLAKTVDVVGSNKDELFEVKRESESIVEVVVSNAENGAGNEFFRRSFYPSETDEIRLYGLGGNDKFRITGSGTAPIRVRILGGQDEDIFIDNSNNADKNFFYDTKKGNEWQLSGGSHVWRSNDSTVVGYKMEVYERDRSVALYTPSYSTTQGLFVGATWTHEKAGFRKLPFAARHIVRAAYGPKYHLYTISYRGDFIRFAGSWDLGLEANVVDERDFRSFYGLGNETFGSAANRARFRARVGDISASILLGRSLTKSIYWSVGPHLQYTGVKPFAGRPVNDPNSGFTPEDFKDTYYCGLFSRFAIDTRDSLQNPSKGLFFQTTGGVAEGIRKRYGLRGYVRSAFSFYIPTGLPGRTTLAFRVGGGHNFGKFAFYQANMLGGTENLRGFDRNRFAGRSSIFTNAELRTELFPLNLYLVNGHIGALAFYDMGRVWMNDETSRKWHSGYGGGLSYSLFDMSLITGTLGFSREGHVIDLSLGYLF